MTQYKCAICGSINRHHSCRKILELRDVTPSKLKENWDEEFEDNIDDYGRDGGGLDILNNNLNLSELVEKYIGLDTKVKISCKQGMIKIERIK